jgi:outer membrane protein assembly factor BamB
LGGVAATEREIVVVDRDPGDQFDIFRCLEAETGDQRWAVSYPAAGNLDYGNSPRATPQLLDGRVVLFGAFGHLTCADLKTGEVVWRRDLRREFGVVEKLVWGFAGSPLAVDGKLVVQPGGPQASIVALDPTTGATVWRTPGEAAAFASPIAAELGGRKQIVGYDKTSLGGWDPATGRRLWRIVPPEADDFNVPTPIAAGKRLLVTTENNGTRAYEFADDGTAIPEPAAVNEDLAPDTHSPVVVGDRLFGVWQGDFYCLDGSTLKPRYVAHDEALTEYATIIASDERLLILTQYGEALLIDPRADEWKVISRTTLLENESGVYSHPAIVGNRLYVRGSDRAACFVLD